MENQDYSRYADDTSLHVNTVDTNDISQKLQNYQAVCAASHPGAQWAKTVYLAKAGNVGSGIGSFWQIKIANNEKALVRVINIKGWQAGKP